MKQEKSNNDYIFILFILLVCSIILNFIQGDCIDNLIHQIRYLEHSYPITNYEEISDTDEPDITEYSAW